jgi:hypothetical protein
MLSEVRYHTVRGALPCYQRCATMLSEVDYHTIRVWYGMVWYGMVWYGIRGALSYYQRCATYRVWSHLCAQRPYHPIACLVLTYHRTTPFAVHVLTCMYMCMCMFVVTQYDRREVQKIMALIKHGSLAELSPDDDKVCCFRMAHIPAVPVPVLTCPISFSLSTRSYRSIPFALPSGPLLAPIF